MKARTTDMDLYYTPPHARRTLHVLLSKRIQ